VPVSARPIAVHVITRLVLGGPTRPVLAALDRMSRQGVRTVLVTGRPDRHEQEARELLDEYPDLPVLRVDAMKRSPRPVADGRALAALASAFRRLRPTVIHTHTSKAGGLGRLAACLAGGCGLGRRGLPPLRVHTFHGHSLDRRVSGARAPLWRGIERVLARKATDVVLAVSPGQREELVGHLGEAVRERIFVVPVAHDARRFTATPLAHGAASHSGDETVLLFVGRGVTVKGLDVLAAAHARVEALRRGAAHHLRVVIAGPMEPSFRRGVQAILGSAGLTDRWEFVGPVSRPAALYERADAVVLPSRSEGTPVSVLEALSMGRPVIASDVGGIPELLACRWDRLAAGRWETHPCAARGALVPSGDVERWADVLVRCVGGPSFIPGDPDERRRFVASVFDAGQRTRELMQLYELPGEPAADAPGGGTGGRHVEPQRRASRYGVPRVEKEPGADQPRPAL